jgi:hypothetical protein
MYLSLYRSSTVDAAQPIGARNGEADAATVTGSIVRPTASRNSKPHSGIPILSGV